jgi:hypothetical protein
MPVLLVQQLRKNASPAIKNSRKSMAAVYEHNNQRAIRELPRQGKEG